MIQQLNQTMKGLDSRNQKRKLVKAL